MPGGDGTTRWDDLTADLGGPDGGRGADLPPAIMRTFGHLGILDKITSHVPS